MQIPLIEPNNLRGGVATIRAMIDEGTPSSFVNCAIRTVAALDCLVPTPPSSAALCTPMSAPSPANFCSPAANARKQADAQTAPDGTTVDSFANLIAAATFAPSPRLPPDELSRTLSTGLPVAAAF